MCYFEEKQAHVKYVEINIDYLETKLTILICMICNFEVTSLEFHGMLFIWILLNVCSTVHVLTIAFIVLKIYITGYAIFRKTWFAAMHGCSDENNCWSGFVTWY